MTINNVTIKKLFALSGNRCAFPGCNQNLLINNSIIGEICHIEAKETGGPRFNPNQSDIERDSVENLLILCANHHKVIDDDVNVYTVERLKEIKRNHEHKYRNNQFKLDDITTERITLNVNGIINLTIDNRNANINYITNNIQQANNILRANNTQQEKIRLYIDDIDNFNKVKLIKPLDVSHFLSEEGYLNLNENEIQLAIEDIINEPLHKKDWGGEENDLYISNIIVNGARIPTAFLLKGNGLKKATLQISNCGSNGDQLVRLFKSPAQLFIVQFVGSISENVINDVESKVQVLKSKGKQAYYCIINGQDTARLLYAYDKLK